MLAGAKESQLCHPVTAPSEAGPTSLAYLASTPVVQLRLALQPQGEVDGGVYRLKLLEVQAGNATLKRIFGNGGHAIEIRRTTRGQAVFRPQWHFRSYPSDSPRNRSHGNQFTVNISFVPRNQNHRPVPSRRRQGGPPDFAASHLLNSSSHDSSSKA